MLVCSNSYLDSWVLTDSGVDIGLHLLPHSVSRNSVPNVVSLGFTSHVMVRSPFLLEASLPDGEDSYTSLLAIIN
jgi:hypothetical protein